MTTAQHGGLHQQLPATRILATCPPGHTGAATRTAGAAPATAPQPPAALQTLLRPAMLWWWGTMPCGWEPPEGGASPLLRGRCSGRRTGQRCTRMLSGGVAIGGRMRGADAVVRQRLVCHWRQWDIRGLHPHLLLLLCTPQAGGRLVGSQAHSMQFMQAGVTFMHRRRPATQLRSSTPPLLLDLK